MQYLAVLVWLAVFAGVATLGYPLAARLFGRFRSRGVGFALPIALVMLWLPVYWLGKLSFGPLTVAVGLAVLVAVAAALGLDRAALREGDVRLADGLEANRSAVVEVTAVFVAAFLFLVAVRSVDPAVHAVGGEKYLDYGMLRRILRSGALPPEDFWFAGEPVQYYYGGHLLAAILTVLTGTAPELAYNLALAGFYATLVAAAYDLASNVAAERDVGPRVGGVFAAFFVGFASNLATVGRLLLGLLPAGLRESIAPGIEALPLSGEGFSYWNASRVISDSVDGRGFPTINEFPLFAWLNGDLHAHMMGTPFLLLAAAIGFALYLTPADDRRRRLALLAVVPVLGFFQIVTDTWSFPSVFGVTYLALAFAPADPTALLPRSAAERVRSVRHSVSASLADDTGITDTDGGTHRALAELERLLVPLGIVGGLVAVAAVLAGPFLSRTMAGGSERSIEFLPAAARSGVLELFAVHGAFLVVFGLYLLSRTERGRRAPLALAVVAVGAVAVTLPLDVLAFTLPLLVIGWAVLRFRDAGYETVLIVAGAGLVTIVEFVYVSEQAGPLRMNTVFKTYMQIWVLWGVGAGAIVATLLAQARHAAAGADLGTAWRGIATVGVALLVVSTSVYGGFALSSHFSDTGEATLDATELPEWHGYEESELAAVDWLDRTADGDTVIVSAPAQGGTPGMYSWNSAIAASLTGVPTVVGWAHEVGYRGSDAYYARVDAVDALYTGPPADAASVIREHDVDYVWVGSAERSRYGDGLVNFSDRPGYEPVFVDGDVVVYEVTESEVGD
jgi:YYY domain-containing protein